MALIFLLYLVSFYFAYKNKKKLAIICFALSTFASIMMFLYHTTSTLDLNF
ncbi:DUF5993 family protein [Kordia sp.]|uniref:DUF5993 family protein n=1 Tax=Kordia sp. TaxID=1965332 RepID=UPI00344B71C0